MQYRIIRSEHQEEPIEHALFGKGGAQKGSTWANHKYIARQKTADSWRYFYTQAELAAAKAGQAGQKVANQAKAGVAKVKKSVADTKRYASDVNNTRNRYKETLQKTSDLIRNAHDRNTKAANEARNMAFGAAISSKTAEAFNDAAREAKSKMKFITAKKYKDTANAARNDYKEFEKAGAKAFEKEVNADKAETRATSNYIDLKDKEKAFEDSINPVKYGVSKALNKAEDAINKGKPAASKLLSNIKDASSSAVDKGKNALDKLLGKNKSSGNKKNKDVIKEEIIPEKILKEEVIPDKILKEETVQGKPISEKKSTTNSSDDSYPKKPDNVSEEYWEALHGPNPKNKKDRSPNNNVNLKTSSDEYIEALYSNSRKNDGSGVSKELEVEYNYRKAAQNADYLGRLTDSYSDDAEKALKKYGRNSTEYKQAYDKMEKAFDDLHDAEVELARWEKQR